ncbi:cupin domain-containing protein [Pseudanabaena sp. FACHB-2040]|uniref:cupin domain-containing protein n=1 Tax=Pseudanabaena sp. FACHB-2040 TaxID=2692859 RepID=UPI0016836091|nr:cupin domain-containing protein [Pseudanabaena sp. FACHB-2040]MBD2260755.1 cupin domain-containing protein [Pseudanabaena sp. FACHB-2040]
MIIDLQAVPQHTGTVYPDPFKALIAGRVKQRVGDAAGLRNFGVNLVTLAPGSASALRHWHEKQDEFVYVISGRLTLVTDEGEQILTAGAMAGFPADQANGHQLVNRFSAPALYLEIGDRTPNDQVHYPDDDLQATASPSGWVITHKDGRPY